MKMNKNTLFKGFFLLAIFLLSCFPLQAVDWGVKFGLNSASFVFSDQTLHGNHQARPDFTGGAYLTFHLSKLLALQPEAHFTHYGSLYSWDVWGIDRYSYKYKMPCSQFPLLFKFKISVEGGWLPSVFLGPYVGVRHNATFSRVIDHGEEEDFGQREDIKNLTKTMDYGLVAGAGLDIKACFGTIIFDVRFNFGLLNVFKDIQGISELMTEEAIFRNENLALLYSQLDSIKNKSFIFMIGLGF